MQDTLLRVFVVALGLIMYPKEDPGVEEWDITPVGMQEYEERLLKEEEKLDQEMTPINQQMTHADTEGPRVDLKTIHEESTVANESDQHVAQISNFGRLVEDMTLANHKDDHKLPKGYFIAELNPSLPQEDNSEPETNLKTSQEDHEDVKEYFNLVKNSPSQSSKQKDNSGSFRDPSILPGLEIEEVFRSQKEVPLSQLLTETSDEDNLEKTITDWEKDYLWYVWNTFSIISMIRFFRKYLRDSQKKHEDNSSQDSTIPVNSISSQVPLPDSDTLHRFHAKCIKVSPYESRRKGEFLEGFANELLEAMRTTSDINGSMVLEDFQMENVCDIIIPFTPPGPYSFQCQLWSNQESDMLPNMQACGKIKMVENVQIKSGCHCESSTGEDMLCLLHCEKEEAEAKITDVNNGLLCMKNTPFLSKSQVTKWFQSTIRQAWAQISHKYEFELKFRNIDAPGALVVRFRSSKMISFNLNPVVKLCDAYFFITPCSPNNADIFWTLSLTMYEDRLLNHLSRSLPENSCHIHTLEILYFLHKKQTALTGRSALQDSHFKTTLMHLLLTKASSQWHPDYMIYRLRDLLVFMEKSLQEKLLHHILIGNPLAQNIELPCALSNVKPVNLFHPLVEDDCLYRSAVIHFQECLKNTHMLIQDYESSKRLDKSANGFI